jgi:hypothetical protein
MPKKTLRKIYFSYVHSVMTYGIIFWSNLPHSTNIFKSRKHTVRIIMNASTRDFCKELFKDLKILTLNSQYIYSLSLYVVKNKDQHKYNQIHRTNTRYIMNLYLQTSSLAVYQRRVYYYGIRVPNHLLPNIKRLRNKVRLCKPLLKRVLLSNLFYHLDEYFY